MTMTRILIIIGLAWFASMFPPTWTSLLLLMSLSAMCLGMALESFMKNKRQNLI